MQKEANEKKLEALIQRQGECESIKENNARDIEVSIFFFADFIGSNYSYPTPIPFSVASKHKK